MSESTQADSNNSSEDEAETKPSCRLIGNLSLLFLCVLAIATFQAIHDSPMGIKVVLGSTTVGAFFLFAKWALSPREKAIGKQIRDSLESSRLSLSLGVLLVVLVICNIVFLPQDVRARIMGKGESIELRIVPVGNLYTILAVQDRKGPQFDLSVHHIARQGNSQSDRFYLLRKISPGVIYAGAAVKALRDEHDSRANEEVDQLAKQFLAPEGQPSDRLDSDTNYAKESWKKFQYLGTDVFRQNDRIEIEIRCIRASGSKVASANFAKKDVLLKELPIQTVILNAHLENNPCIPTD